MEYSPSLSRPWRATVTLELHGLEPLSALQIILERFGLEVQGSSLREQAETTLEPGIMIVRALNASGHPSRLVEIGLDDLRRLSLPTLLELAAGGWVVLLSRNAKGFRIQDARGVHQITPFQGLFAGSAVDFWPGLPSEGGLWKKVGGVILAHRKALGQVVLVSAVLQLVAMASPFITREVLDKALPQGSRSMLALAVAGILLLSIAQSALGALRDWTNLYVETRLDAILQRGILDHTLHLPFANLAKRTVGEILQAFSGLSAAKDLLSQRLFATAMDGITAFGYLFVMVAFWPKGAAAVLGTAFLMAVLVAVSGYVQLRVQRRTVEAQIRERDWMVQMIHGVATLKAAGVEDAALHRWFNRFQRVQGLTLERQRLGLWNNVGLEAIRQLLMGVLLVWGGVVVLHGELSLGSLFAFLQMSMTFGDTITQFASLLIAFLTLQPQVEKGRELLALTPEPRRPILPPGPALEVNLQDVWFRYGPEDPWVFRGLDLKVQAGEVQWVQWPSGGGKSTLLRILAGLLEPERGTVCVGKIPAKEMRSQMVYMPQGAELYASSILENLRILSAQAPHARLLAAAEASGLAKLVETLPMGMETVISEGGGNLSGGQRQLVLLTAAMATQRPVLLLDEAFANLDWLARSNILSGEWFKGKTVIYASHDVGFRKG